MSIEPTPVDWEPSDDLAGRLDQPDGLHFPEDWTLSQSWQRAQAETDTGESINDAERMVWLDEGDPHRVVFALEGDDLRAECGCDGYRYNGYCAHLYSCWWRWVRGRLVVTHLDTGREYRFPPSWLCFDDGRRDRDLSGLTPAELDAYLACDLGDAGVREYARKTGRVAGTVGNLLSRARDTVGGQP